MDPTNNNKMILTQTKLQLKNKLITNKLLYDVMIRFITNFFHSILLQICIETRMFISSANSSPKNNYVHICSHKLATN